MKEMSKNHYAHRLSLQLFKLCSSQWEGHAKLRLQHIEHGRLEELQVGKKTTEHH